MHLSGPLSTGFPNQYHDRCIVPHPFSRPLHEPCTLGPNRSRRARRMGVQETYVQATYDERSVGGRAMGCLLPPTIVALKNLQEEIRVWLILTSKEAEERERSTMLSAWAAETMFRLGSELERAYTTMEECARRLGEMPFEETIQEVRAKLLAAAKDGA